MCIMAESTELLIRAVYPGAHWATLNKLSGNLFYTNNETAYKKVCTSSAE